MATVEAPANNELEQVHNTLHEARAELLDIAEKLKQVSSLYYFICDLKNHTLEPGIVSNEVAQALYAIDDLGGLDVIKTLDTVLKDYIALVRKLHKATDATVLYCNELEILDGLAADKAPEPPLMAFDDVRATNS